MKTETLLTHLMAVLPKPPPPGWALSQAKTSFMLSPLTSDWGVSLAKGPRYQVPVPSSPSWPEGKSRRG